MGAQLTSKTQFYFYCDKLYLFTMKQLIILWGQQCSPIPSPMIRILHIFVQTTQAWKALILQRQALLEMYVKESLICCISYSVRVICWIPFGGNFCTMIAPAMRQVHTRYKIHRHHEYTGIVEGFLSKVLLFLWSNTVRPYLEILDGWITCGILQDSYAETCVKM